MRVNMIRGYTLLLLHYLLTQTKAEITDFNWKNTGPGRRITDSSQVLVKIDQAPLLICSFRCSSILECLAFNYGGPSQTCELLKTTPIVAGLLSSPAVAEAPDWNIYTYAKPQKCPAGGVPLPYDIPYNLGGPTVEGYTCSSHSWILDQMKNGMNACRLVWYAKTDVSGNDAPNYNGKTNPYHEALRNCFVSKCVGVACDAALTTCWLKTTPVADIQPFVGNTGDRNYWRTECQ
ncbi:uncharacterized protein LOC135195995 [Macrobrachium nipponense]|uniref:uncharacterized protein LOC135195995 n=1 Tax=Macrobrachium nipponense TaxID=159736 RepID=UPI0030C7F0EB